MRSRSPDTDPDAERVQIELLRRASPAQRAGIAIALSNQMIDLAKAALRRSMPGASEEEIGLRFVELHYGRALAVELRRFLAARRP